MKLLLPLVDHERFAPLLYGIVVAGVILGVASFVQSLVGRAPASSPAVLLLDLGPPALVALLFVQVNFSLAAAGRGLPAWVGAALLTVVVLRLSVLLLASEAPGEVVARVPRLTNFAYALLAALVLAAYVGHRLDQTYGLLAALLFFTTPPLLVPAGVGVPSLDLVFYWTSTLLCLFLWGETGKTGWLITGGLCLGFIACVARWEGAVGFAVLTIAVLVFLGRRIHWGNGAARPAVLFLLSGALPLAVVGGVGYVASGGDPGFLAPPVMGRVAAMSQPIFPLPPNGELLLHAWALGPAAVCFLPWAFKGKWGYEKRILLAMVLPALVFAGYTDALKAPGVLPIVPLLAILASFGIHNLYMNVRRPVLLFSSVFISLGWNGVIFWNYFAG